jgi:F0F1-type ATP synthase assembly protein I
MAARLTGGLIGPEGRRQLKLAGRFASVGIELAAAVVVGYFGGRYLDEKLETGSILSYVGLIAGIVSGFLSLYRLARGAQAQANRESSQQDDDANP